MDSSGKPQRRVWVTGIMGFILLLGLVCWIRRVPPAPTEYVGSMEANHPWMVFDPTMEQDLPSPYADKKDPNVMYLIFIQRNGLAIKIDFKTKAISPVHFTSDDGDPSMTIPYKTATVTRLEYVSSDEPIFEEFRGTVEKRKISHMFGFPVAAKPGTREATLRTGYWYVVDHRIGHKAELLRVKIKNSELTGNDGLGVSFISPDKKWIVFTLANHPARTFIFNRESTDSETFQ